MLLNSCQRENTGHKLTNNGEFFPCLIFLLHFRFAPPHFLADRHCLWNCHCLPEHSGGHPGLEHPFRPHAVPARQHAGENLPLAIFLVNFCVAFVLFFKYETKKSRVEEQGHSRFRGKRFIRYHPCQPLHLPFSEAQSRAS